MKRTQLLIGCVADDFTGAGDIASFFRASGLNTAMYSGIPDESVCLPEDVQVLVIALKSRTQDTESAVKDSLAAFRYLVIQGASKLYFKYCSTFDSTPHGNIGPVIDALMEAYSLSYTILCPSLPINARTVKDGILYVNGIPLAETHMKNHPLTPMWASEIRELMREQGKYPCVNMALSAMEETHAFENQIEQLTETYKHFYICPDYWEDAHAELIVERFRELQLYTGGSGLAYALGKLAVGENDSHALQEKKAGKGGNRIIFVGSCSQATQRQVRVYLDAGLPAVAICPEKEKSHECYSQELWKRIEPILMHEDVMIYASGSAGGALGDEEDSEWLENVMADVSQMAVKAGVKKIVVAGGETSGAITKALGFFLYLIGESVSAGVPVLYPMECQEMEIVLKSGNFGKDDILLTALT